MLACNPDRSAKIINMLLVYDIIKIFINKDLVH